MLGKPVTATNSKVHPNTGRQEELRGWHEFQASPICIIDNTFGVSLDHTVIPCPKKERRGWVDSDKCFVQSKRPLSCIQLLLAPYFSFDVLDRNL